MLLVPDMNRLIMVQLDYRDLTALSCVSKSYQEMVDDNEIWIQYLDREYSAREKRLDFKSLKRTYQCISRVSLYAIVKSNRVDLLKIRYPDYNPKEFMDRALDCKAFYILEYWVITFPNLFKRYSRLNELARFLYEHYRWEGIESLSCIGFTLPGRYHNARLINTAIYHNDIEKINELIKEGCCPDTKAYNYILIENKTEILSLLSKSGVFPNRKGIREAIVKNGVETIISLLLYRNEEKTLKIALYQSAIRCKPAFVYLLQHHSFPDRLANSAKTICRRN